MAATGDETFKYEIAFSLCDRDVEIAQEINSRFSERINTFLYSEKQHEVMFGNIIESFSPIYAQQSRLVLVLFRKEWGESKNTNVESIAIQNRLYELGRQDFLMLIRMDDSQIPDWYDRKYIYGKYDSSSLDKLIQAIETRLNIIGNVLPKESPLQRIRAIQKHNEAVNIRFNLTSGLEGAKRRKFEIAKLF